MIRRIVFIFLFFVSLTAFSQRASSSPYSVFGIGEEFNVKTVEQVSMGGIGVAYSSASYLNFINPAANANLKFSTYSFGMLNNTLTIKDASNKQSSTSTSLSYFAFGAPIGQKAGFSVGMQPISSVGYSLKNQVTDANGDVTEISFFSGKGGVNRVYGSFGVLITKGLSFGIEADFAFGKIKNSIINQRKNVSLATKYEESATVRGGSIKIGIQYKKVLKNYLYLDFGTVIKLSNRLKVKGTSKTYTLTFTNSGGELPRDISPITPLSGNFKLPIQTILGAGIGKANKWYTGFEYEYQNALDVTGYLAVSGVAFRYGKSNRISFGGFYLPKINSISSYFQRISYRAGLRFEKTGLLVNGTSTSGNFTAINDFGISFGLGLPLGNRLSNVNLGFEFGKKGITKNNLIQENYFNFRLSLSLNDIWFIKRQID